MRKVGPDRRRDDDRQRSPDAQLHAHFFRNAYDAKHLIKNRHDDRAAADAEHPGQNAGDEAAGNNGTREPKKLADGNAEQGSTPQEPHPDRAAGSHAAAVCVKSASVSMTIARACTSTSEPAPAFTASVARCRRNARAPGTAWNRPCRWRVTECRRVPRASSRSI